MKLETFDFIEDSINKLNDMKDDLEVIGKEIEDFFSSELQNNESFSNVKTRIKGDVSLKEKILRNNYYIKHDSVENLFKNLSDTIGARIECRFIKDEKEIYKLLLKIFDKTENGKHFYSEKNENIFLFLDEKQPQKQRNGFKLFRIDGMYKNEDFEVRFELQIKSLVNIFWSEIEHKILYKNFNYVIIEDFYRDIMASIKENLTLIDTQLMLLHDNIKSMDNDSDIKRKKEVQSIMSKLIHTLYTNKLKEEFGFIVDFRKTCDIIVVYMLEKLNSKQIDEYGEVFFTIIRRINDISQNEICFSEYIEFERYVQFEDELSERFGKILLGVLNRDFMWNLFFRILFDIDFGDNTKDFEEFTEYVKNKFLENIENKLNCKFEDYQKNDISKTIMLSIADVLEETSTVNFFFEENLQKINSRVSYRMNKIKDYDVWNEFRYDKISNIKSDIREIVD